MLLIRLVVTTLTVFALSPVAKDKTSAWSKSYEPPKSLTTEKVFLEPLGPEHAEIDHAALMSSREHLRKTLRWGDWPADDMTVEANRKDLARHAKEFVDREGYAYTVLSPDKKRCVGCVYMKPVGKRPRATALAYWVVEDELVNDLDDHLVNALFDWIERDWALDTVVLTVHADNTRGMDIVKKLKLRQGGPPRDGMTRYVWQRK